MPSGRIDKSWLEIGPGGVIYVLIGALMLAAAIYTQANLLFWAFGLMLGGIVISLAVAWLALLKLSVQRVLPEHGVVDEPMVIRYRLHNDCWMPLFALVLTETWGKRSWHRPRPWLNTGPLAEDPRRLRARPFGWVLHMAPHATVQAEATSWPARRGTLEFERFTISTWFPFGVVRRSVDFEQHASVLVYPPLYRMQRRVLHRLTVNDPSGRKRLERAGGYEEFFGLRQYRDGDNLKMIDWKRTAKTGQLVSREMTMPSPPRVMLALDLHLPQVVAAWADASQDDQRRLCDLAIERAVCLAASIVCDSYSNGYQIGMIVLGADVPVFAVHHSLPHRTRMLEALARVEPQVSVPTAGSVHVTPTVIVRAIGSTDHDPGDTVRGAFGEYLTDRAVVLSGEDLEQFVQPADGGAAQLLTRTINVARMTQAAHVPHHGEPQTMKYPITR